MELLHTDAVFRVPPGTSPDYDTANPLLMLLGAVESTRLAAGRECYPRDHLQYLFPLEHLELYGPAADPDVLDARAQDQKTDFQKQNVRRFLLGDTRLVRGWVAVDGWEGAFLRLSYRAGPDSGLARAGARLGDRVGAWVRVGSSEGLVEAPYNDETDRYEVELWGFPGSSGDLRGRLDGRGRDALDRGELVARPDLVRGAPIEFGREALEGRYVIEVAPTSTMHPVLPLDVHLAWSDLDRAVWDSRGGANHRYQFSMAVRGWDHHLGVGISPNPHGGVGFLEYRNLFSNYGRYAGRNELGRPLEPWNFDAFGTKGHAHTEPFMAVEYMDVHLLNAGCGIGLHRHRDNQEAFVMLEGRAYMVIGDWAQFPWRDRALEVRSLRAGHLALLKGGNLHGLMNTADTHISLFMFGGYD